MGLWVDVGMRLGLWNTGTAKLKNDLAALKNEVNKPAGGIGSLIANLRGVAGPAALATAAVSLFTAAIRRGSDIADQASQIESTTDFVQRYGDALSESGVKQEEFVRGVAQMIDNLTKAKQGGEAGQAIEKMFRDLGVTWDDIRKKSPEDIFKAIVRNGKDVPDALSKFKDIFGKPGVKLFGASGQEVDQLAKQIEVMTDDQVKLLDSIGDAWTRMWHKALTGAATLIGAVKDTLNPTEFQSNTVDLTRRSAPKAPSLFGYPEGYKPPGTEPVAPKPVINKDYAEKIAKIDEDAANSRLTIEQQILKLKTEEARLLAEGRTGDAVEAHKKLVGLESQQLKANLQGPIVDSLRAIGAGFGVSASSSVADKTLSENEKQTKLLEGFKDYLKYLENLKGGVTAKFG
jgi:hypothetical protein